MSHDEETGTGMSERDSFHQLDQPSRRGPAGDVPRGRWFSATPGRVLLLEPDALVRDSLLRTLAAAGHAVSATGDAASAVSCLAARRPVDAFLADGAGPRGPLAELLAEAARLRPEVPVVVMVGPSALAVAVESLRRGAYDALHKPFDPEDLLRRVARALDHAGLRRENAALRAAADAPASADGLLPLAEVEKRVILDALSRFDGHRVRTATALGIGVRTLGIKLKKWREAGELVDA